MDKFGLLIKIEKYKAGLISFEDIENAVEAYSSASNDGKPIVSGSLPPIDGDKLAIAWQALEWVGFSRGEEFNDDDVLKMLGGNDR